MSEEPDVFRMSDEEPPRRKRFVPPPGQEKVAREFETDSREYTFTHKFAGLDPFIPILAVALFLWIGLGFTTRWWPWMGLVLAGVGLLVCLVSKIYLHLLIFREDPHHGWMSLFSEWHRLFFLHQNIELTWRPMIITGCGLLMILTGVLMFLGQAKKAERQRGVTQTAIVVNMAVNVHPTPRSLL